MSELSITALVNTGGEVLQCGYASLKEQARALERIACAIDERFVEAVRLLLSCEGQLVVAGTPEAASRLASGLSAAGCRVRSMPPGVMSREFVAGLGPQDLVVVFAGGERTQRELEVLGDGGARLLLVGGEALAAKAGPLAVRLPVAVDVEACPPRLLAAVQELALLALGDALAAAVAQQRRCTGIR